MAKVAHEGNPKYDNIRIVEGDLLSEAELEVSSGGTPPPPSPPEGTTGVTTSHAEKYVFSLDPPFGIGLDGTTTQSSNSARVSPDTFRASSGNMLEYSRRNGVNMSGAVLAPSVRSNLLAIDLDKLALGEDEPYRIYNSLYYHEWVKLPFNTEIRKDVSPPADFTLIRYIQRGTIVAVTNTPRSGFAVAVDPTSTVESFTGYVGAYDWGTDDYLLMQYDHQPLADPGVILAQENRVTGYGLDPLTTDDTLSISLIYVLASSTYTISTGLGLNVTSVAQNDLPFFGPDMRGAVTNHHGSVITNDNTSVQWKNVASIINFS